MEPGVGVEVGDGLEAEALEQGHASMVAVGYAGEDVGGAVLASGVVDEARACDRGVAVADRVMAEPVAEAVSGRGGVDEVDSADEVMVKPDAEPIRGGMAEVVGGPCCGGVGLVLVVAVAAEVGTVAVEDAVVGLGRPRRSVP